MSRKTSTRSVTIVRNVLTGDLTVYSNREKIYKIFKQNIECSYRTFCKILKEEGVFTFSAWNTYPSDVRTWYQVFIKEVH